MTRWGDLFNPRQKLALITFADKVRQAHAQMRSQSADPDFAKAVVTYLALGTSDQTYAAPFATLLPDGKNIGGHSAKGDSCFRGKPLPMNGTMLN
jgi:hypothetical protein